MWCRLGIINHEIKKDSSCNYLCINSPLICAENGPYGGINATNSTPEQGGINRMKLPPSANRRRRIRALPIIIPRRTRGRNCQAGV